jgi:hypothetical protein
MFLYQQYEGEHTLFIYNNSEVPQRLVLDGFEKYMTPNKHVILVNNHLRLSDGQPYEYLGEVYKDAIKFCCDYDVATMYDDDDIFLKYHLQQGVDGYLRALNQGSGIYTCRVFLLENEIRYGRVNPQTHQMTIEPACFVDFNHLKRFGFSDDNLPHSKWLYSPIENYLLYDELDTPTFMHDASDITALHTSKEYMYKILEPDADVNTDIPEDIFKYLNKKLQDHGDGTIHPLYKQEMEQWFNFDTYFPHYKPY